MKYIEEENKDLIALRNNYFTLIIVISSGLAGLFFTNISLIKVLFLAVSGIYFDCLYIAKFQEISKKLKDNIERLK